VEVLVKIKKKNILRNTVLRVCLLRYSRGRNYLNTYRNENLWKRICKHKIWDTHF